MNVDLEYDNEKYLYYLSRKTVYYPGFNKIYKIDTELKEIVDSIKIGFDVSKIEYSKKYNRLYALNNHVSPYGDINWEYPGYLYVLDCNDMTCIDSTEIPGARLGFLADSIEQILIKWDRNDEIAA
ncbi:MAG: hypothetical protein JXB49_03370 [Bacteroidales bacterium]|nr:hypothetical protein [Bacteroidales bacterium]